MYLDFLSNRTLSVVVDGYCSTFRKIYAGVPQGSLLVSTLFSLHINDLLSATKNPIHSFADDSTLHSSFSFAKPVSNHLLETSRNQISLSQDIQTILDWGAKKSCSV